MTWLYVLLGIILFFTFLLSLKGSIRLEFNDEILLSVKVLCFKIKILPKKTKSVNYKDYTYDKHKKRLRKKYLAYLKKQEKKEQKAQAKKKKKEEKKALEKAKTPEQKEAEKNAPKRSILDWLKVVTAVLENLFGRFAKHLHIKVARLIVNVATGDAAKTAILYGAITPSVGYIIELLKKITNVDGLSKAQIQVNADYVSEKTTMDLCFVFSLRVWHLFNILFGTAFAALKEFLHTDPARKAALEQSENAKLQMRRRRRKKKKQAMKNSKNTAIVKTTK